MTGNTTSSISTQKRYRFQTAGFILALAVLLSGSGCTFLENFQKDPAPAGSAQEIVQRRTTELLAMEDGASATAPEELGAARVVLDEMSYFEKQGDSEEVERLDEKMSKTLGSIQAKASGSEAVGPLARAQQENSRLQIQVKKLNDEVKGLKNRLKARILSNEIQSGTLTRRLEVAQTARDDAEAEVVRIRARIQGMASRAEASAMFAEARVLIDRMVEEAYQEQALEEVELAEHYLKTGKETLDTDNPAGAAYLFDRVSEIYTSMLKSNPRVVTVKVRSAALRKSPSDSSQPLGYLSQGDSASGLEKKGKWIRVKTSSGLVGWIRREQVQ